MLWNLWIHWIWSIQIIRKKKRSKNRKRTKNIINDNKDKEKEKENEEIYSEIYGVKEGNVFERSSDTKSDNNNKKMILRKLKL